MKNVLSSIDLICVARELSLLKGSFIKKIYHVGDELLFHLYHEGGKQVLRVVVGKLIHLSSYVKENPQMPSSFCMYLRKYIKGAKLVGVSQPNYERVIIFRFIKGGEVIKLIFELFGQGNVIVASDDGVIKHCLRVQRFTQRVIKPYANYELPPSDYDLSAPDFVSFRRVIKSSSKPDLVRSLAVDAGLGGAYAEEVCLISSVDKTLSPVSVSDDLLRKCFDSMLELVKRAKYLPLEPRVIMSGDRVVDAVPFILKFYEGKGFKEFSSYNEALDFFYARYEKRVFEEAKSKAVESKRSIFENRLKQHEEHVESLKHESSLLKAKAFALKNNLYTVEKVINSLLNARKSGYEWGDIKEMIEREKAEGSSEALLVKDLKPFDNLIVIDLADGIEMPLNVSVTDFMNELFERAKKLEGKIEGALEAVERSRVELESVSEETVSFESNIPKQIDASGKQWFERFKWFRTSEGLLVISGRNAQQNEELVRKYLEPDDLVFHADIHGSPFSILRNGRKALDESKLEAAKFTAAHSRAWGEGVAIDVFYVLPYQVGKDAPSGEYLRTGGFMIRGKKEYFKSLKPELSLGVQVIGELSYRLISGPKSAVSSKCKFYVTLEPGSKSVSEIVHELVEFFKVKGFVFDFETIKASLPSGGFRKTI